MKTAFRRISMTYWCFAFAYLIGNAQHTYVIAPDNPFAVVSLSRYASPALVDIDDDGDQDLFVGQYNSNDMLFYRNTGTAMDPLYEQQTGTDNPLDNYVNNSGCCAPNFVDIDGDGDMDMFSGVWVNIIRYFRNDGDAMTPAFVYIEGSGDPLEHVLTEGICTYPAFVDIDGDNDADVFITDANGNILYYENTGDINTPVFVLNETDNPLATAGLSARSKIAFHDVNGDGLIDAVIGHDIADPEPEILYFENTGTAQEAVFTQITGMDNPFEEITGTEALAPVFADIDDDGDKDLVIGTWLGVRLYEAVSTSGLHDSEEMSVTIYPNPADERVYITAEEDLSSIELINTQGVQFVQITQPGRLTTIGLSEIPGGTYFVKLILDMTTIVEKVVVR